MTSARLACFLIVMGVALFMPFWVTVAAFLFYAFLYGPVELFVIALSIDTQFGDLSRGLWYSYTLMNTVVLVAVFFIRPYLRYYHE